MTGGKTIYETTTPESENETKRHLAWKYSGDKKYLEAYYADMIKSDEIYNYMDTEGSMWTDRVYICERELQYSRMGGVAMSRNAVYPGHAISWKFKEPAMDTSVGILVHYSTPEEIKLEVYNLEDFAVDAEITGWEVLAGKWEITQGIDADGDAEIDGKASKNKVDFGVSQSIPVQFEAKKTTMVTLKLVKKGQAVNSLADLGISSEDVKVEGNMVHVKLHNLGAVDAQPATIAIVDGQGKIISSVQSPMIKAPADLQPKTADVQLEIPGGLDAQGLSVMIDPEAKINEVTRNNNLVIFGKNKF